jgi:hypothetical protein
VTDRRDFTAAVALALVALPFAARAQPPTTKVRRIGFLGVASAAITASRVEAFRAGLREFGYAEGKKSQNGQSVRTHDPSLLAGARGSGYRVTHWATGGKPSERPVTSEVTAPCQASVVHIPLHGTHTHFTQSPHAVS